MHNRPTHTGYVAFSLGNGLRHIMPDCPSSVQSNDSMASSAIVYHPGGQTSSIPHDPSSLQSCSIISSEDTVEQLSSLPSSMSDYPSSVQTYGNSSISSTADLY
mmetsp:Transcript_16266/g.35160  ORF Transcript_16266/g.35160 Transcript_16266/m.35160 type:complete len:104 (-) Transcript_16266:724-1035(-)